MKVSFDGARRNISREQKQVVDLVKILKDQCNIDDLDLEGLKEAVDQVSASINVMNCFYDDENEDFNDLSDKIKDIEFMSEAYHD